MKLAIKWSRFSNFNPWGTSGFVLGDDFYVTIHTWPEFGEIAIDIYGENSKANSLRDRLKIVFGSKDQEAEYVPRLRPGGSHDFVELPEIKPNSLGTHVLSDCNCKTLSLKRIQEVMLEAARRAAATIVKYKFRVSASGEMMGVIVISESHLSIRIMPELGMSMVDVFTCGDLRCDIAANYLFEALGANEYRAEIKFRLISEEPRSHKINS